MASYFFFLFHDLDNEDIGFNEILVSLHYKYMSLILLCFYIVISFKIWRVFRGYSQSLNSGSDEEENALKLQLALRYLREILILFSLTA
jgi:hypothetical protein